MILQFNTNEKLALWIELVIVTAGLIWLVLFLAIKGNEFSIKKINDQKLKDFFMQLNRKERNEFVKWFVYEPDKKTGCKRNLFINNEDNTAFFKDFVRYSSIYKDTVNINLMTKMFEFAKTNYYDESSFDFIDNKLIKILFNKRNNAKAAKLCKTLCYQKIGQDASTPQRYAPALKILVILESVDNPSKALKFCELGLINNLSDGTKGGYLTRIFKLQKILQATSKNKVIFLKKPRDKTSKQIINTDDIFITTPTNSEIYEKKNKQTVSEDFATDNYIDIYQSGDFIEKIN